MPGGKRIAQRQKFPRVADRGRRRKRRPCEQQGQVERDNVVRLRCEQLVNDVRKTGCTCGTTAMPPVGPISWNDQLAKVAYDHSVDMDAHDYFSHDGLDGSNPGQRITAAGYFWSAWGENIAQGYSTEQLVMSAWLGSEGHCKNIMNGGFKDMGVGRGGNYWTQDFGSK